MLVSVVVALVLVDVVGSIGIGGCCWRCVSGVLVMRL